MNKKRRIVSLENLDAAVKVALMKKYPSGFQPFIQKMQGIKGETLTVVPLETEDSLYLVKVRANQTGLEEDEEEDEGGGATEIPENTESFGDEDEFSKEEEEDTGYDEPVEEYDDEDDEEEDAGSAAGDEADDDDI